MRSQLVMIAITALFLLPQSLLGQSGDRINIPGEFIESTSPIRGGGSVTSRAIPGQGVQTFVEIARLPVNQQRGSNSAARSLQHDTRSTSGRATYPYPAASGVPQFRTDRMARNVTSNDLLLNRHTAYQIAPQARTAQANCCGTGTLTAPPANFVPSLNIEVPGQTSAGTGQAVYGGNTLQLPPVTYQNNQVGSTFANWWNPIWTGSGAYQPIIRFRNMPPGTYLGQGIIGQPTAYVDGQPMRNLLRYISP